MARDWSERNGIGETADSVGKPEPEHQKLFPTTANGDDAGSSIELPGVLLETESDPASLVEGAMDNAPLVVFGQRRNLSASGGACG